MSSPPVALNGRNMRSANPALLTYKCFANGKIFCFCDEEPRRLAKSARAKSNANGNAGRVYWSCDNRPFVCDFWLWDDEKVASGWEPANGLFSPPASPAKRDGRNLGSAPTRPSASRTAASSPTASSRASTSRLFREDSSDDEDDDILIISPSTHSDAPKEERLTPELPPPSKLFKTSKGSGAIADLQYRLSQLERKVTALADDKAELKPENRGLKRKLAAASLGLQV